jgi:hypothetical protein
MRRRTASPVMASHWRAIARRRSSSGLIRWSRSSAASSVSICTQWTRPVNAFS